MQRDESPVPLNPQRAPRQFRKSHKLDDVCYEIRGASLSEATRLEEEGHRIIKLNIGNPAPFGLEAPEEILRDVIHNLRDAQGYGDSKGIFPARKAIMQYSQQQRVADVQIDDIYIGNGVSELIVMAMQGMLDNGDEILIPAPDYPLWTAAVNLAGGKPVHYLCDEQSDWAPDIADIKNKITARTKGLVVINPNNPTGAVYSKAVLEQLVEIARQHDLAIFADEIYEKITYDGAEHIPLAALADDVLFLSFNGLSKAYRVAGFRTGWMIVSGAKQRARDYVEGLDILASMRLCANMPSQFAIQTALGGYQSIFEYTQPGGRLYQQRNLAHGLLNQIPGVTCVKPKGALYMFPKLDRKRFNLKDDERLVLDLLRQEKILMVQGTGFNWPDPDHLRIVFLPREEELSHALLRFGKFLENYSQ